MEYSVLFNGESYNLPKYSIAISEKFDTLEKTNSKITSTKDKLKNIYKLMEELLGKEQIESAVGKISEIDPNALNILYLNTIKAYNKPLSDYQEEQNAEKLNNSNISQMVELLKALGGVDFSKMGNKDGVPYKVVK